MHTHYVSGFFPTHEEALEVRDTLIADGLPPERLQIFTHPAPTDTPVSTEDSHAVLKNMVVDGAIGTGVGTGMGALAEVALVSASVSLFIASPLLAPLAMMGWGASIGALIGVTVGATAEEKAAPVGGQTRLSDLVADAISRGQVVLVAQTCTARERVTAQDVIQASMGDYQDVKA